MATVIFSVRDPLPIAQIYAESNCGSLLLRTIDLDVSFAQGTGLLPIIVLLPHQATAICRSPLLRAMISIADTTKRV